VVADPADPHDANPYVRLLDDALRVHGVEIVRLPRADLRTVLPAAQSAQVLHLQWLEPYVGSAAGGIEGFARVHARLVRTLRALRSLGRSPVRLVWTVHNLRPHERPLPWTDWLLAHAMARMADALVVHSRYAAARVQESIRPSGAVWVAPHGHYLDAYPTTSMSREDARRSVQVDDAARVFLCFGQVREYKRIDETIRRFRACAGDDRLLVAGRPVHQAVAERVRAAAAGDSRVHLMLRDVSADEIPVLHRAADAAILNYREVFSSGALMLALSQGLPVIAPRDSSAAEILHETAGVLFDEPNHLSAALQHFAPSEQRRTAALMNARAFPWSRTAERVIDAYTGRLPDFAPNA
jgi:glycosyltransferase involved in cell wall biosynthesis